MLSNRLKHISKIGVEVMGDLADSLRDKDILRLENLDTDIRPPKAAIEFTKTAIHDDNANSYLPFLGLDVIRKAATELVSRQSGNQYDWKTNCVISAGGLSGILNVLLATINPGDEVLMTDPTYVGLINRVRLVGGIPKYVPLIPHADGWRLDTATLNTINTDKIKMVVCMSPAMPSGATLNENEWDAIARFCEKANGYLLYNAAMERILFDGRKVIQPAGIANMKQRTITVGSASKEYRMIGWRVGWVVGPDEIMEGVARVSITNVVCQTGIAMGAVAQAITQAHDDIPTFCNILEQRRNLIMNELQEFSVILPHGGWSMLMDVSALGMDSSTASKRLLQHGKIAATPMINWGTKTADNYIRFVFSNEPIERLKGLGNSVKHSLIG